MSFGEIIIYVIAGIAAIGFIMGLIGAIMQWREDGVFKWTAPIFGLFFIFLLPLAFIIEMIDFFKESKKDGGLLEHYRNEKQRKQENKRREKEYKRIYEAYKKGELRREELPRRLDGVEKFELYGNIFASCESDLVYVENEYNERINQIIKDNLEYIQKCLDESKYFKSQFVYLPNLKESLAFEKSSITVLLDFL